MLRCHVALCRACARVPARRRGAWSRPTSAAEGRRGCRDVDDDRDRHRAHEQRPMSLVLWRQRGVAHRGRLRSIPRAACSCGRATPRHKVHLPSSVRRIGRGECHRSHRHRTADTARRPSSSLDRVRAFERQGSKRNSILRSARRPSHGLLVGVLAKGRGVPAADLGDGLHDVEWHVAREAVPQRSSRAFRDAQRRRKRVRRRGHGAVGRPGGPTMTLSAAPFPSARMPRRTNRSRAPSRRSMPAGRADRAPGAAARRQS